MDEDHASLHSWLLGGALFLFCLPGLVANVLVAYMQAKRGMLTSNNSSMHKLSFNLLVADNIHLALIAFYLAPASALQSWLLPENYLREIIAGRALLVCWYNMLIDLCLLAVNRYLAVCKPHSYANAFSSWKTLIMIACSWVSSVVICVIGEEFMPCCQTYLYYKVFSYGFPLQTTTNINYNNNVVILPLNTLTSVVLFVACSFVIYNMRTNNTRVADAINAEALHRRRQKEIRYALQVVTMSGVFVSVWVVFNIFTRVVPSDQATDGIFSVCIFLEIINASATSFVTIIYNKEFQNGLKKMFCCGKFSSNTTTTVQRLNDTQTGPIPTTLATTKQARSRQDQE